MTGAADGIRTVRPLYWALRRELWENRSVYLAPAAVAAVFLVGFFIGLFRMPGSIRAVSALGPMAGQAHHFRAFASEVVPYGIKR